MSAEDLTVELEVADAATAKQRWRERHNAATRRSWTRVGTQPLRWAKYALHAARARARQAGIEFSIRPEDLLPLPEVCPLLGIGLDYSTGGKGRRWLAESPSLDRIDNSKGYVAGNVWVISNRANTLKRDATLSELETLVGCLRSALKWVPRAHARRASQGSLFR